MARGKGQIKTELVLEGEAKYKKGMSDAASAIKVLDAEQKLAKAQFEATGDAQQYAADKARILKEKIAEQKKAVELAETAVRELTEKGVQPNSKVMQTWRTKLINAKTSLTNMETQLQSSEDELSDQATSFSDTEKAAGDYDAQLRQIGAGVDFQATIDAIDNVRERIKSIITFAAKAAKALWDLESDAGTWADETATAASQAGIDVETYQSWQYASRFIDTSVDDIVAARKRVSKALTSMTEDDLRDFNQLGVATLDTNGKVRDSMDVLWDVVDAMGSVEDYSERERLAMNLLGRSYDNLNPLVEAGSDAYKQLAQEGMENAVVSADNVTKLNQLNDAQQELEATWNKTKYDTLAALAPTFTHVSDAMAKAVTAFDEFLQTAEGQAALDNLNNALSGIIGDFTDTDFEGLVNKAATAITGLNTALQWIADNGELVSGAFIALGGAFVGLTVAKDVLSFLQLLKGVKGAASGVSGLFGGAKSLASAGKGLVDDAATAASKISDGVKSAGDSMVDSAKKAAEALTGKGGEETGNAAKEGLFAKGARVLAGSAATEAVSVAGTIALPTAVIAGAVKLDQMQKADAGEKLAANLEAVEQAAESVDDGRLDAITDAAQRLHDALWASDIAGRPGLIDEAVKSLEGVDLSGVLDDNTLKRLQDFLSGTNPDDWDIGSIEWLAHDINDQIAANAQALADTASQTGEDFTSGFADGIETGAADAADAASGIGDSATDALAASIDAHSPSRVAETLGGNYSAGFAQGIYDRAGEAITAAQWLAQQVEQTLRGALEIHSPSGVAEEMGAFFGEGFALGVEDQIARVEEAVNRMASATARTPIPQTPAGGRDGGASGGDIPVRLVLTDGAGRTLAEIVTPYVDAIMGAKVASER